MVRSNFDYSNRTSSGERLGASIATDFLKKALQTAKPARTSMRPAKSSSKGRQSLGDELSSPRQPIQTRLDIKIPNKALTDSGLVLVTDALAHALKLRSDLVLIDLNLSGNELTSGSLIGLANVLHESPDLIALDLSNNSIAITTKDGLAEWEEFAHALLSRQNLVKVDLGHNPQLGARALESLARIALSLGDSDAATGADPSRLSLDGPEHSSDADIPHSSSVSPHAIKAVRGQSYKSIGLQGSGMDERCALFASVLMLRPTEPGPFKIQWHDNDNSLGKDATHLLVLLKKLEDARNDANDRAAAQAQSSAEAGEGSEDDEQNDSMSPLAGESGLDFDGEAMLADIERAIKKVQRNIIIEGGYSAVELWSAAMHVFVISRKLYALTIGIEWKANTKAQSKLATPSRVPSPDPRKRSAGPVSVWGNITNLDPASRQATSFALPLRGFKPLPPPRGMVAAAPRVTGLVLKSNGDGHVHQKSQCRAGAGPLVTQPAIQVAPKPRRTNPKWLDWQEQRQKSLQLVHGGASNGYRDPSLTCQLPLTVCKLILSLSADKRSLSLLSERQKSKALEWGQLHDSLMTERDWRNRDKASQVWMLLEALECLEYERQE